MANDAESIRGEWIATVSSDMSDQANDAVSIQLSRKKDGKTLEARHKATRWWATVFFMICGFAVFIDPLFCYIYVIDRDNMRISSDPKAMWAYFGLRTTIDVFYFIDIIVFLCGGEGKKFGACCWKQENDQKSTVIEKCYLLRRILVALPIPELFGALWYRLAVQRQIDCWKPHCEVIRGNNCTRIKDFQIPKAINITHLQALCPTNSEDKKVFDFGIYLYALQPNSTCSSNLLQRISQSFWWALRNLSSFGENLQTSMHTLEIYFSIVISISGIALFVVCISATIKG
ncbi:probable cyclic nucleotide-gated ion channel 10 isoform X2 [Rosa rugosa]|uniref:probable cyclic nucleotide-gated ion channel 10 isoform X2 n=1 Tax=Rosa rugosa TaxID=74645 RepID=UPI002B40B730|nr:probable cyclic nucleotide-gated ion channel 10 isoform X2 [Rosa rugosa]